VTNVAGQGHTRHPYANVSIMPPKLVPTGVAAQAIGVDRGTLVRWWQAKKVTPATITVGGHARWDVDDLKRQLDELRD